MDTLGRQAELVARRVAGHLDGIPETSGFAARIRDWTMSGAGGTPARTPTPTLVETALAAAAEGPCAPIVAALGPLVPFVRWAHYPHDSWTAPFADRMVTGRLVGPDALLADDSLAFGVFAIREDTLYPEHGHAAEELYLALSGDARFLSEHGWIDLPPGATSVQRSNAVHAARTRSCPALFLWSWTGDVSSRIWALDQDGKRFYPRNPETEPI